MTSWDPKQTLDSIGIGGKSEQKRSSRVAEAIRNELSILFHQSIGMNLLGEKNENGIPVVADYAGPGSVNVVFEMDL